MKRKCLIFVVLLLTLPGWANDSTSFVQDMYDQITLKVGSPEERILAPLKNNERWILHTVAGDLSDFPGTAEEKYRAVMHPGSEITIDLERGKKYTPVYSFGNMWVTTSEFGIRISYDGEKMSSTKEVFGTERERLAWEIIIFYILLIGMGLFIGKYEIRDPSDYTYLFVAAVVFCIPVGILWGIYDGREYGYTGVLIVSMFFVGIMWGFLLMLTTYIILGIVYRLRLPRFLSLVITFSGICILLSGSIFPAFYVPIAILVISYLIGYLTAKNKHKGHDPSTVETNSN